MTVAVITSPQPFISVADAKQHVIVDHSDDDMLIESFIAAASAWIDGPAGWLGRAIGVQQLEYCGWIGRDRVCLPFPPALEIVSITARDRDGDLVTADAGTYSLDNGHLVVSPGASWVMMDDHRVRYWAGYGINEGEPPAWSTSGVPAPIKVAVLMLVAQWYKTRQAVAIGASVEAMPFGVEALLSPYRVLR